MFTAYKIRNLSASKFNLWDYGGILSPITMRVGTRMYCLPQHVDNILPRHCWDGALFSLPVCWIIRTQIYRIELGWPPLIESHHDLFPPLVKSPHNPSPPLWLIHLTILLYGVPEDQFRCRYHLNRPATSRPYSVPIRPTPLSKPHMY